MDFLAAIIDQKRQRVAAARGSISLEALRALARQVRDAASPHALVRALTEADENRNSIIAEFKRRSPSKGEIRRDADPAEIAKAYEAAGAVAVSVLTEEDYFAGALDDLRAVRQAIALPLLRKDFIFEEYQVYESAAAGADAVLLIVAALDVETLGRLRRLIEDELSIDALVEVHTATEMDRAIASGAHLIGVNNRDLGTLSVSLETSARLARKQSDGVMLISESGIRSAEDMRHLRDLGYRGFLIGEALMLADDPETCLRGLL